MSERDELAAVIAAVNEDLCLMQGDSDTIIAAILAAGYRKPRTITTAEELDALPFKSAILDSSGAVLVNDGDTEDPWASLAEDFHGGPIWTSSAYIALPATVLHEGKP
jgi:hypothetical protein